MSMLNHQTRERECITSKLIEEEKKEKNWNQWKANKDGEFKPKYLSNYTNCSSTKYSC